MIHANPFQLTWCEFTPISHPHEAANSELLNPCSAKHTYNWIFLKCKCVNNHDTALEFAYLCTENATQKRQNCYQRNAGVSVQMYKHNTLLKQLCDSITCAPNGHVISMTGAVLATFTSPTPPPGMPDVEPIVSTEPISVRCLFGLLGVVIFFLSISFPML